jgi:transcriptional regulator with XRE-family HTH domain
MEFKLYKIKNNLTNEEIAQRLDVSRGYVSSILNGYYRPSCVIIARIIDFTHAEVTADTFFRKQINKWKKPTSVQSQRELFNTKPSATPQEELPNTKQLTHIQPVSEPSNIDRSLQEVSNE